MFAYYNLVSRILLRNMKKISYTHVHSFEKLLRYQNHSYLKNNKTEMILVSILA